MISGTKIAEIVRTYEKHGWILRRVLLSELLLKGVRDEIGSIFGDVKVAESDIDAVWFSRRPSDTAVAWELRHLSDVPYALLESIDESNEEFEEMLRSVESRLRESIGAKRLA